MSPEYLDGGCFDPAEDAPLDLGPDDLGEDEESNPGNLHEVLSHVLLAMRNIAAEAEEKGEEPE